jgi:hypothetical protein
MKLQTLEQHLDVEVTLYVKQNTIILLHLSLYISYFISNKRNEVSTKM